MAEKTFQVVGIESSSDNEKIQKPSLTFWQDAWRRLKLNKVAVISMWFLIAISVFTIVMVPFLSQQQANKFNPNEIATYKDLPPKSGLPIPGWEGKHDGDDLYSDQNVPAGKNFILGTDDTGRSVAKRVIVGIRISLTIAIVASLGDLIIGVSFGVFSAWKGGWIDLILQRFIEILSSVPFIVIVTLFTLLLGAGIWSVIISLILTGWINMARQIRAQTLSVKEQDYVLAATVLGERPLKIAMKHIIPNISSTIIVQLMMTIPQAITSEAILSALGLGVQPPTSSLGSMINDARDEVQYYPYLVLIPGTFLVLISLAFYLFGDGLRDAFDPKSGDSGD
ncbi:ABC transporter permease [Oenococcus oeni]|uniref:OptC n=4 Tax=Oenococcus oeni TaxID=1247 RepID=A8DPU1_OENOE|nr:ABC transporter permease [Oenococcus oeni]EAV40016.1 ABC-type oligopeptide transport system, integral membrane protein [Oenococcus oeni ATCC BAA-1163]ABI34105.1 OptC [Oenococcus oeni]EJO01904.1 ABC-type dipeptide/oligopeptide/nickel transport system, permease component [Oenococcus oeni AWRIB418]KDE87031.1 peptide ABC transporter permease [Oenococcus oeni]KEP88297.1 peptide ABC transporter permease [Oenococcus oeni IOEB_0501]